MLVNPEHFTTDIICQYVFLRKNINYIEIVKIKHEYDELKYKIYIFTASIVNLLTMYGSTNQVITNKLNYDDKH